MSEFRLVLPENSSLAAIFDEKITSRGLRPSGEINPFDNALLGFFLCKFAGGASVTKDIDKPMNYVFTLSLAPAAFFASLNNCKNRIGKNAYDLIITSAVEISVVPTRRLAEQPMTAISVGL